ncbi:ATP-dependent 6-phosphofructokinase [Granulosicoccaceae sp. 1_MG-2023]|nr:ATP-dependent 6-phosphofructokinase [Granulosicoccaceae sp. 1_MG-2023]
MADTHGIFDIENLGDCNFDNPMRERGFSRFIDNNSRLRFDPLAANEATGDTLELAGPRRKIFFLPGKTRAAIVTCGGLCPGLNAVIRGIVLQLWHIYGCKDIRGIRYGYSGLSEGAPEPITLTPDAVRGIRADGGTILGSARGTPPTSEIVDYLQWHDIDMLFTIGGDGTMRGALKIWQEIRRRGLKKSVVGIPKTIDNDIPMVQRSFGFETAVAKAADAINCASTEARGVRNGIGLVKLMGRNAGFIAANACLASGNANFCLIPEVPFTLQSKGGFLDLLEHRLRGRGNAVIVLAEGAGQDFFAEADTGCDASGNKKPGDIGIYLRDAILAYFRERNLNVVLKYIEPSYLIRSTGPNASDQIFCDHCARAAVHAAMAGKGGMLIGDHLDHFVHVPMQALQGREKRINPDGDIWFSVRENTGQPDGL